MLTAPAGRDVPLDPTTGINIGNVDSSTEAIVLMQDAIMAEQLVSEGDLPGDWREALTAIAHRTRAMLRRRPWVSGMQAGGGAAGPRALLHLEQSLAAVATTGLPAEDRLDLIASPRAFEQPGRA